MKPINLDAFTGKQLKTSLRHFWERGRFITLFVLLTLFVIASIATNTIDVTTWILPEKDGKPHNNFMSNPTPEQVKALTSKPVRAIKIYPNPIKESLTLSFDRSLVHATVQVYDRNGKIVFLSEGQDGQTLNLDVSDFEKGNYLINVEDNHYNYYSTKFTRK